MNIAIIDLGTNTFNLLVAETTPEGSYVIRHESKCHAKLGKGGINHRTITPEAVQRGLDALRTHLATIARFEVNHANIHCFATAAIRSADNGNDFVNLVKQELGLTIRVIDGQTEAQLIFDGIKQVVPIADEKVMVLDIGGGSNEFIIANRDGVIWKHSFNLGVSKLFDKFSPNSPITQPEIDTIEAYFEQELQLLFDALQQHPVHTLIGSSGSFDTLAAMISAKYHPLLDVSKLLTYHISMTHFHEIHRRFLASTIEERAAMKRMDPHRVELIVLASMFIHFIVKRCDITQMWQCAYALKEGALLNIIHKSSVFNK
ncbi:exopolyphosphatase/guanosine-5'-triphosphate,3'-diphosphate pyrophosphatase [Breznakibacter xylanolyticus]|uniref:Exopolyphosphatase/guanosine-5'-triphosphate, 3'-diphosphate pyrophosphatase n=1 Tax=Breznakibacter xylanolyticus TaxID=990 RepID=A0A2W7PQS8_9BACT|nr:phosphatase [Breznakibacter xylanolyticus]PZX11799.1 exopolyphosphatase/guanosine-5'-triphosphate,3'-diphosphate pyrophosphatase [Breznakibacter xylanolyticus]